MKETQQFFLKNHDRIKIANLFVDKKIVSWHKRDPRIACGYGVHSGEAIIQKIIFFYQVSSYNSHLKLETEISVMCLNYLNIKLHL